MVASNILRKSFHFENPPGGRMRTLRASFHPEFVYIEKVTYDGLTPYQWANFTVSGWEVQLWLPAGEYHVTLMGGDPDDIQRWETDGGHD